MLEVARKTSRCCPSWTAWWLVTLMMEGAIVWVTVVRFGQEGSLEIDGPSWPEGAAGLGIAMGSVLLRTRAPWVFLSVATALNVLVVLFPAISLDGPGYLLALLFAVYSVASVVSAPIATALGGVLVAIIVSVNVIIRGLPLFNGVPITFTVTLALALALGQMNHARKELLSAAEGRARDAEQTREALAATRVAEEKLHIARDLHDSVGHQVAVINLQAGAAMDALPNHPDDARQSISQIQVSAAVILDEIGDILRELRDGKVERASAHAPRISDITELADALATGGLVVDVDIAPNLPPLHRTVEEAAFKIVQEGLLNIYKYGVRSVPATLRLAHDEAELLILLSNRIDDVPAATRSTSYGVRGIRERARALGGDARVHVNSDLFELQVRLPVEQR